MKIKKIYLLLVSFSFAFIASAQDDWKSKFYLTGYLNILAEYSSNQDISAVGNKYDKHVGIGLDDAGFLVSFKPLDKLEIKSTMVYTPWVNSLQEFMVELYGAYEINDQVRIAGGKFLTPLTPSNLYFYAPLNPSVSLPMLVSHHFIFPQSISGFQIQGKIGDSFSVAYNATYGSYISIDHPNGGVLGISGQEELIPYMGRHLQSTEESAQVPRAFLGGTGRICFDYKGRVSLGINTFEGTQGELTILNLDGSIEKQTSASRRSYGIDIHANAADLQLNAEYWTGSINPEEEIYTNVNYNGYYAELIYSTGKFKPWVRYESLEDAKGQFGTAHPLGAFDIGQQVSSPMSSYSFGIAYRPIYETIFKLQYKQMIVEKHVDKNTPFYPIMSKLRDYDHLQFSFVLSF